MLPGYTWAFLPATSKMPSMRNGNDINQDVKNISTGNQHTAHIISWDGLHSRGSCQKIITAARDASGNGAAWVHYKSQPSSLLSHPLLSPSSSWEPGEFNALSSIHSLNRALSPLEPASSYWLSSMPATTYHGRGKWGEHVPWEEGGPVRRWLVEFGLGSSWISPSGSVRVRPRIPCTSLNCLQLLALYVH